VGLVASVVLGAETPVHVRKDGLFFEVYCTKDTAAYFRSPSTAVGNREKRGLSAFSTSLAKKHDDFYTIQAKHRDKNLAHIREAIVIKKGLATSLPVFLLMNYTFS
jgi:hypothetical protein